MKTHRFLIFLFILPMVYSCIKDQSEGYSGDKVPYGDKTRTKIEGVVLEYGTRKPLANVMVFLDESQSAPFSGGGTYYPIDTTFTDAEGKFVYDFKHIPNSDNLKWDYQVRTQPYLYYPGEYEMESGYRYMNKELSAVPYSWLRFIIKNVNPNDSTDYIWIGGGNNYYGTKVDTIEIQKQFGNQSDKIVWFVGKKGNQMRFEDTLFFPGHDTVNYEILY